MVVFTLRKMTFTSIVEVGSIPASLTINGAYSFPTSDGSSGQVLKTDGSGALTFQNESGGSGATLSIFKYTVTSNTTVFTGNDDDNQSLSYTVGGEQVFLNGVKLVDGGDDYTLQMQHTITLVECNIW